MILGFGFFSLTPICSCKSLSFTLTPVTLGNLIKTLLIFEKEILSNVWYASLEYWGWGIHSCGVCQRCCQMNWAIMGCWLLLAPQPSLHLFWALIRTPPLGFNLPISSTSPLSTFAPMFSYLRHLSTSSIYKSGLTLLTPLFPFPRFWVLRLTKAEVG